MSILNYVSAALLFCCITLLTETCLPQYKPVVLTACGLFFTGLLIFDLSQIFNHLFSFAQRYEYVAYGVKLMIKCVVIALITQFGAEICTDCGQKSLSSKVELAGKTMVLSLVLPVITTIIDRMIFFMDL